MNKYGLLALLALVGGYLVLLALVLEQVKVSTAGLVALFILLTLPIVAAAGGAFYLASRARAPRARADEQVVEAPSWRELPSADYAQLNPPAAIPRVRRVSVPIQYEHGTLAATARAQQELTILETVAQDEEGQRVELTCSLPALRAALELLQEGQQPTRASFNARGIMASDEVRSVVSFLRVHGWVKPIPPGSTNTPARWVDGASAGQLEEFLSTWS